MLMGIVEGLLCCLTAKYSNAPVRLRAPDTSDGFEFVEVKPGRVLRVRHVVPERPAGEEVDVPPGVSVRCKRKIVVYRGGQLLIENLAEVPRSEILHCQDGNTTEVSATLEVEMGAALSAGPGTTPPTSRRRRRPKRTVLIDMEQRISSCKGSQADVALFFLHGVGGSSDIWANQLDFFSHLGYEVIAPDLLGHGASSAPEFPAAYTFYALAEDLRAVFKKFARRRNILIGHSYGVSFCTFLAHEYPEQVHKVVMINGGGPTALEPSLCSIFNLPSCMLHCLTPFLAWSFLKAGFARQGAKEKQLLRENNAFNVSPFVLRATMSGQYWPEGDEVYHAELTVPTLLLHGMCDKFVPIEEDQRMAEILLIGYLKVIEEGSHMVMMECPETVNTVLHEFFLWEPDTAARQPPTKPDAEQATPAPAARNTKRK
ncbi:protein ABHD8-like [Paramormyrops kingsleyae]|uniref:Protein ABHD8 n=1 Tax=Paramormyrops kingsleyae TaxID=1676925 RepID=A0A3B3R1D9_9TELE|nr:protein ABHD8-like [Paramormyrops kingsleyae]XP_023674690.1 protein ABHD8-like [Paramormyrops kingsleyae]XP_023674691.1 protein ABHD8-like [Paramormyrops kingsleyae]XP_023674692.1 protein ABHD8-like [Paramormyrops kingsleyae]XP_023674693.1 protein ABHD8-like [Paramormyrops kingsleyae]